MEEGLGEGSGRRVEDDQTSTHIGTAASMRFWIVHSYWKLTSDFSSLRFALRTVAVLFC